MKKGLKKILVVMVAIIAITLCSCKTVSAETENNIIRDETGVLTSSEIVELQQMDLKHNTAVVICHDRTTVNVGDYDYMKFLIIIDDADVTVYEFGNKYSDSDLQEVADAISKEVKKINVKTIKAGLLAGEEVISAKDSRDTFIVIVIAILAFAVLMILEECDGGGSYSGSRTYIRTGSYHHSSGGFHGASSRR